MQLALFASFQCSVRSKYAVLQVNTQYGLTDASKLQYGLTDASKLQYGLTDASKLKKEGNT